MIRWSKHKQLEETGRRMRREENKSIETIPFCLNQEAE